MKYKQMNMRPIVQQKSTEAAEADSISASIASTSINVRNWTPYFAGADNARKICVEMSPDLTLLAVDHHTISGSDNISKPDTFKNCSVNAPDNTATPSADKNTSDIKSTNDDLNTNQNQHNDTSNAVKEFLSSDCDNASTLGTQRDAFKLRLERDDSVRLKAHKKTGIATNVVVNQCTISNVNSECAPLLRISSNKSITLVKQNSTSLIFTTKDVNPVVHRKRVTLVRSSSTVSPSVIKPTTNKKSPQTSRQSNDEIVGDSDDSDDITPIISHTDEIISSPQKRHSYHWHSERGSGLTPNEKPTKRKRIRSWYAIIGSSLSKDSAFDSDSEVIIPYYIILAKNCFVRASHS